MIISKLLYFVLRVFRAIKWRTLDFFSTLYYRSVCKNFGSGSSIGWGTWISKPWLVSVGNNVYVSRNVMISTEGGAEFFIDDDVHINSSVEIDFTGGGGLSSGVLISRGVCLFSHSHGRDPRSKPIPFKKIVGKNVWIGASAIVMHTCEFIGADSIVGAGAIVTKNIIPGKVVVSQGVRELNNVP